MRRALIGMMSVAPELPQHRPYTERSFYSQHDLGFPRLRISQRRQVEAGCQVGGNVLSGGLAVVSAIVVYCVLAETGY
jgi:hypothetical protein